MANIGALSVSIGADTTDLRRGLDQAERDLSGLERTANRVGRGLQNFGSEATRVGRVMSTRVSAPMAAAGAAAFAFANRFANAGNEIAKTAREAGMGAQEFQELSFAIGQVSQASDSEVRRGLGQLNQRIAEAADGSERAQDSLLKLGFSMEEIESGAITSEQAFEALSAGAQNLRNSGEAASVASALLGDRIGRSLGPALYEGGEAVGALREKFRELGLGMDEDTLGASEDLVDQMDVLKRQFAAVGVAIASELIPFLSNTLVPAIQDKVIPALQTFAQHVGTIIQWFGDLPEPVQQAAGVIAAALGAGGPILLAVGVLAKALGALVLATGPIGLFIAAATTLYVAWQKWGDDIIALFERVTEWIAEKIRWLREDVIGTFTDMGDQVKDAFGAPFDWLGEKTDQVTDKIGNTWEGLRNWLVGNSVIPDMIDDMSIEFDRMDHELVSKNQETTNALARDWERASSNIDRSTMRAADNVGRNLAGLFDVSKEYSAATAFVATLAGQAEALRLGFPAGLIAAAKIGAAGFGFVRAIKGASPSGGGGSGGAAVSGGGGPAAAAQSQSPGGGTDRTFTIEGIQPGQLYSGDNLRGLLKEIEEASEDGLTRIRIT